MLRVEPVRREWAEALAQGDAVFSEAFGIPVEAGWFGVPEALPLIVDAARKTGPHEWGPHLFFGDDGALVGNGGWKGDPVDGAAELGYAVAPARQGRGVATAVVRELVARSCGGPPDGDRAYPASSVGIDDRARALRVHKAWWRVC